jgi:hypothetical protein
VATQAHKPVVPAVNQLTFALSLEEELWWASGNTELQMEEIHTARVRRSLPRLPDEATMAGAAAVETPGAVVHPPQSASAGPASAIDPAGPGHDASDEPQHENIRVSSTRPRLGNDHNHNDHNHNSLSRVVWYGMVWCGVVVVVVCVCVCVRARVCTRFHLLERFSCTHLTRYTPSITRLLVFRLSLCVSASGVPPAARRGPRQPACSSLRGTITVRRQSRRDAAGWRVAHVGL